MYYVLLWLDNDRYHPFGLLHLHRLHCMIVPLPEERPWIKWMTRISHERYDLKEQSACNAILHQNIFFRVLWFNALMRGCTSIFYFCLLINSDRRSSNCKMCPYKPPIYHIGLIRSYIDIFPSNRRKSPAIIALLTTFFNSGSYRTQTTVGKILYVQKEANIGLCTIALCKRSCIIYNIYNHH